MRQRSPGRCRRASGRRRSVWSRAPRQVAVGAAEAATPGCLRAGGGSLGVIATTRGPLTREKDLPCREAETSRPVVLLICTDRSPAVAVSVSPDSVAVGFAPPVDWSTWPKCRARSLCRPDIGLNHAAGGVLDAESGGIGLRLCASAGGERAGPSRPRLPSRLTPGNGRDRCARLVRLKPEAALLGWRKAIVCHSKVH